MKSFDFKELDFYSSLINDYLSGELKNKGLIDWDYSIEQINKNKSRDYSSRTRKIVHEELIKQYSRFELSEKETENLNLFSLNNSFTILALLGSKPTIGSSTIIIGVSSIKTDVMINF